MVLSPCKCHFQICKVAKYNQNTTTYNMNESLNSIYLPNCHMTLYLSDIQDLRSFFFLKIYLLIDCYVGSSFLCQGFLQLRQAGATLHHGAQASHYRGLSCCRAQAPDTQAQQLWLTGLVAPWHVGSSQTRARTRVPCISRQICNRCTTREALTLIFKT